VITSSHNEQLKTIRKLRQKHWRERLDLFAAEGEDLVEAADAAGWEPEVLLIAAAGGVSAHAHTPRSYVEQELLDEVSSLGSGTRVIGVYRRRWSPPGGELSVYLHGVGDPGNVGTLVRSAHALCDGPVVLGPGCADPFSPKAVRSSMGSLFARPPARAGFGELSGLRVALDARAGRTLGELEPRPPLVLCLGAEREGLPQELLEQAEERVRIALREQGPESLNVAMAATVALYEVATRMAGHA
jgi:TrmH family RNA methyltransferase